ncbi:ankyrin [Lophium mytilinum]|uniref:Ankyrin n=1 Tax=Lophium mytilinum TaxID=390894 RepID=A0A6A6QB64_9PEZI|nr:ankyrin [Lophium mytilinum]
MEACWIGSLPCVEALLERGAKIHSGDYAPIHLASENGSIPVVRLLISAGADVNDSCNTWSSGPLAYAVKRDQHEIAEFLLSQGANINWRDWEGDTALTEADSHDATRCISMLLSRNADYTFVDEYVFTILHQVASCGSVRVANLLAEAELKGLDPNATNKKGKTALQVLESRVGVTGELLEAFKKLMDSVSRNNHTHQESTEACNNYVDAAVSRRCRPLAQLLDDHTRSFVSAVRKHKTPLLVVFLLLISHLARTMLEGKFWSRASAFSK